MLPKAHLSSHSKMSGSRWVITPSWLSGSLRSFLYCYSVYSASVGPILLGSFIVPIFAWNVPLVSLIFLKRSLVLPILLFYFFALITEEGFLMSLLFFETLHSHGYIFPFLLCLSLVCFSQLFVRPPQTAILPLTFPFLWDHFDHHLLYKPSPSIVGACFKFPNWPQ